jgi:hypothetical protein
MKAGESLHGNWDPVGFLNAQTGEQSLEAAQEAALAKALVDMQITGALQQQ